MRKKDHVSLTTVLAVLCAALILCAAGTAGAGDVQAAGGLFDGCGMYRTFQDINEAWREGIITNRDLMLAEVKAFYEEISAVNPTCSGEVLDHLKRGVLEDVHRLSHELLQSDKLYLTSLSVDLAEALDREPVSSEQARHGASVGAQTTFGRIARALEEGRIGLKESVLLRAKLLYAPQLVPRESEFAPKPGEAAGQGCATGFYMDVHRVKDILNDGEKAFLRSLSPDLDAIARSWEGGPAALPYYPQLTLSYTGKHCVVHYTTAKGNLDVTNAGYAKLVASFIDEAFSKETKDFRAAIPEGGGLLQVYCLANSHMPLGALGMWMPVTFVKGSNNKRSGYILMQTALGYASLNAVAFHEYFHGVQFAYNGLLDTWFLEGSAEWAVGYYGGGECYEQVEAYFRAADSIFNTPNDNLFYADGSREYSTCALDFFFTGKYGVKFMVDFFNNSDSASQNDAVLNLGAALSQQNGAPTFGDQYKEFLIALYNRNISLIGGIMPFVVLAGTELVYGAFIPNDYVFLLGANFYECIPPVASEQRVAPFIAWLEPTNGVGSAVGILAKKGAAGPSAVSPFNSVSYLPNAQNQAVFIATDVTYTSKADQMPRPYQATVITPYIKITKVAVTPGSTIQAGVKATFNTTYDLQGTVAGQPFGVQFLLEQICNTHPFTMTSGPRSVPVGSAQVLPFPFDTTYWEPGTYYLTAQMSVPLDEWQVPQVKSKAPVHPLVVTQ